MRALLILSACFIVSGCIEVSMKEQEYNSRYTIKETTGATYLLDKQTGRIWYQTNLDNIIIWEETRKISIAQIEALTQQINSKKRKVIDFKDLPE